AGTPQPVADLGAGALLGFTEAQADAARRGAIHLDGQAPLVLQPPAAGEERLPIGARVWQGETVTQEAGDLRVVGVVHERVQVAVTPRPQPARPGINEGRRNQFPRYPSTRAGRKNRARSK